MTTSHICACNPLSPRWLRCASLFVVGLLHATIFSLGMLWPSPVPASLGSIEVAIESEGSSTVEQAAGGGDAIGDVASAAAMAPPAQADPETKNDDTGPPLEAPPEPITTAATAAEAPSEPVTPLAPEADRADLETPPPPPKVEQPERPPRQAKPPTRKPKPPPRRDATKRVAAATYTVSSDGENTMASDHGGYGNPGGTAQSGGRSRASYAALVVSQIQAHKFYPRGASSRGEVGIVAFTLAIGPDGSVTRFSVTRSSGSAMLDQTARQIAYAIRLPPPPGGSFVGASKLNFSLSR